MTKYASCYRERQARRAYRYQRDRMWEQTRYCAQTGMLLFVAAALLVAGAGAICYWSVVCVRLVMGGL